MLARRGTRGLFVRGAASFVIAARVLSVPQVALSQSGELLPPERTGADRFSQIVEAYGSVLDARMELEFPGGNLAEYLELLQDVLGIRNIVSNRDLSHIEMGEVSLSSVTYEDAVMLARLAELPRDSELRIEHENGRFFRVWLYALQPEMQARTGLWSVEADGAVDVAERVLAAVEAAATFMEDPELELSFHEDTGTLLARGNGQALATIDQAVEVVLGRLEETVVREEYEELLEELEVVAGQRVEIERDAERQVEESTRDLRIENERLIVRLEEMERVLEDSLREMQVALARVEELREQNSRLEIELRVLHELMEELEEEQHEDHDEEDVEFEFEIDHDG